MAFISGDVRPVAGVGLDAAARAIEAERPWGDPTGIENARWGERDAAPDAATAVALKLRG